LAAAASDECPGIADGEGFQNDRALAAALEEQTKDAGKS
jgi:hypothetical protein